MENIEEFKLGDFILQSDLATKEGISKYKRMVEWCNKNHKVIESDVFVENMGLQNVDEENLIPIYIISEPPQPLEPTKEEKLRAERTECLAWFKKEGGSDDLVCKCVCEGLIFKDEYPELYAEGLAKRKRINEIEIELAKLGVVFEKSR